MGDTNSLFRCVRNNMMTNQLFCVALALFLASAFALPTPNDIVPEENFVEGTTTFDPAKFVDTMTATIAVKVDGVFQTQGTLEASSGHELRGVAEGMKPPFGPFSGKTLFLITMYANADADEISFTFLHGDKVYSASEVKTFVSNANYGNVVAPWVIDFKAVPDVVEEPAVVIEAEEPAEEEAAKVDFAKFSDTMTASIAVDLDGQIQGEGEMIAMHGSEIRGVAFPAKIPFGPFQGKHVFMITVHGDKDNEVIDLYFKNKGETSKWSSVNFKINANYGNVVSPLMLTFYKVATPAPTLAPTLAPTPPPTSKPTDYSAPAFDHAKYEHSFSATIAVLENGAEASSGGVLECYSGSELRGVAKPLNPPFGPYAGKTLYSIMCYGDKNGERMTVRYVHKDGHFTTWIHSLPFIANANHGNVIHPTKLQFK